MARIEDVDEFAAVGQIAVATRVSPTVYEALRSRAFSERVSIAELIRQMLREATTRGQAEPAEGTN